MTLFAGSSLWLASVSGVQVFGSVQYGAANNSDLPNPVLFMGSVPATIGSGCSFVDFPAGVIGFIDVVESIFWRVPEVLVGFHLRFPLPSPRSNAKGFVGSQLCRYGGRSSDNQLNISSWTTNPKQCDCMQT